jgi:exodeoxyribonuclease-3
LNTARPDILGIQENKIAAAMLTPELITVPGYHVYWSHAQKSGYSGVTLYCREKPIAVREGLGITAFDTEGRTLIAEYPDFVLFNIYFPNGQRDNERLQYKLAFYDAFLTVFDRYRQEGRRVIVCGDFNTAHKAIDLARPRENENVSGFLPVERAWMDTFVSHDYLDTFRLVNPNPHQYTWWHMRTRARERNVGWRIDYFFISPDLEPTMRHAAIHPDVMGSDHCPVSLELAI